MCGEYTDYTRSYHHPGAQFWVGSSRNWSVFLERPNTGRHEKAPVRCPCSRLAALHGDPRTLTLSSHGQLIDLERKVQRLVAATGRWTLNVCIFLGERKFLQGILVVRETEIYAHCPCFQVFITKFRDTPEGASRHGG